MLWGHHAYFALFLRCACGRFVSFTLLAAQAEACDVAQACDAAMNFLLEHRFIVVTASCAERDNGGAGRSDSNGSSDGVSPTQLGKARSQL